VVKARRAGGKGGTELGGRAEGERLVMWQHSSRSGEKAARAVENSRAAKGSGNDNKLAREGVLR
jgi:hypothetical protein